MNTLQYKYATKLLKEAIEEFMLRKTLDDAHKMEPIVRQEVAAISRAYIAWQNIIDNRNLWLDEGQLPATNYNNVICSIICNINRKNAADSIRKNIFHNDPRDIERIINEELDKYYEFEAIIKSIPSKELLWQKHP